MTEDEIEACVTELKKHLAPCHAEYGDAIVKTVIAALDAHRKKQGLVTVPVNSLSNTKYQQMDSAAAENQALIDAGLKMP